MEQPKFKGIIDFLQRFPTEESCIDFLIETRWNGKPVCPHCKSDRKIYKIRKGKILTCADCRKQFTVKVGTIFEDSALSLQKWFMAVYILTAHKKGISSLQLSRDINVTQKTAWFMLHRIRFAVKRKSFDKPITGTVEIDETFIGGKEANKPKSKRQGISGYTNKVAVFGIVQRQGVIYTQIVNKVDGTTLKPIIRKNVSKKATVVTDGFGAYYGLDKEYKHEIINHQKDEWYRDGWHTNTIEGFWSLLKRGIHGIYHSVSEKHLHRYTDEFSYRYNSRKVNDSQRFQTTLSQVSGRLTYQKLIED